MPSIFTLPGTYVAPSDIVSLNSISKSFGLGVVGYGDGMHSGFAFPYKEFVAALYFGYGIGKDLVLTVLLVALPGPI